MTMFKAGALQNAILTSANFSIIATDEKGIIQLFNVGAERMLGYARRRGRQPHQPERHPRSAGSDGARPGAEPASSPPPIAPGFEALAFKASRGIEDIYELTYIRKDGSRFPGHRVDHGAARRLRRASSATC